MQKEVCSVDNVINIVLTLFTRSSLLTHFSQLLLPRFGHLLLGWLLGAAGLSHLEPVHVPGEAGHLDHDVVTDLSFDDLVCHLDAVSPSLSASRDGPGTWTRWTRTGPASSSRSWIRTFLENYSNMQIIC